MTTGFNYFNFVSEKTRFVRDFDGWLRIIPMSLGRRCHGEKANQRCESERNEFKMLRRWSRKQTLAPYLLNSLKSESEMKSLNTVIFSFCSLLAAHVTEFYAKWLAVSEMFGFLFNTVVASFVMMI